VGWTGMRQGEAFGLQWQDIDFHHGFLELRRTVGYRHGELLTDAAVFRIVAYAIDGKPFVGTTIHN